MAKIKCKRPKAWSDNFDDDVRDTANHFRAVMHDRLSGVEFGRTEMMVHPVLSDFAEGCVCVLPAYFANSACRISLSTYFGLPNEHNVWHLLGGISGKLKPWVERFGDIIPHVLFGVPCNFDRSLSSYVQMEQALELRTEVVRWAEEHTEPNDEVNKITTRWYGSDRRSRYCAMYKLKELGGQRE